MVHDLNKQEKDDAKTKAETDSSFKKYIHSFKNILLDKDVSECISELEKKDTYDLSDDESNIIHILSHSVLKTDSCSNSTDQKKENESGCLLGDDVLNDLEILKDYQNEDLKNTVYHNISKSINWSQANHNLLGSEIYLKHLLSNPICDIDVLRERQHVIKKILKNNECFEKTENITFSWNVLRQNEKKLSWFLDNSENKNATSHLHDLVYMNYWLLNRLNHSPYYLTSYNLYKIIMSPLIGIFTPICYVIIPYIVLRLKWKVRVDFISYLKMTFKMFMSSTGILPQSIERFRKISVGFTIVFYFQGLFNSVELARATFKLCRLLVTKMNGLMNFIHHSHNLVSLLTNDVPTLNCFNIDIDDKQISDNKDYYFKDCFEGQNYKRWVLGGLDGNKFTLFSNFGKQLSYYKYLNLSRYTHLLKKVYLIDCLLSVGKLTTTSKNMCWAEFKTQQKPHIEIKGCFHPCLPNNVPVVRNDISLCKVESDENQNNTARNMLLTGPNAGGKSTIIKALMISALLAQTITVSNSSQMTLTPFRYINTQINIPDCKGKQSLFEAEMLRSKKNFEVIDSLKPSDKSLIAMDEIFSSTNPVEGIAGAYAIAHKLGQNDQIINIISTHYTYLSKLERRAGLFTNFKMNVTLDDKNNIVRYPYKLYRGVSKQYIALELLRKNGFDDSIIEEALTIKESLLEIRNKK